MPCKSICARCEIELKPELNGVVVAEMFHEDTAVYRLWLADLYKCPGCGIEIVQGFGSKVLMEHFEGDIDARLDSLQSSGRRIIFDNQAPKGI